MLKTNIYNTIINPCIYNASGCLCTSSDELDNLLNSKAGAILTKSSTLEQRIGNPEPRLKINNFGSINSMGIPNYGLEYYNNYYDNNKNLLNKPFIQSIYPYSISEMENMINAINNKNIELNLSCPNLNKMIITYDYNNLEKYLDKLKIIKTDNNFSLKLPPYYHNYEFDNISNLLLKYDVIDNIVCINSICNGLLVDIETETTLIKPNYGLGGIGGNYILPTALANVNNFYKRLDNKINIIGCGGITSGQDIFKHILCGAKAVQVGTTFYKEGIACFERLEKELIDIMNKKNYNNIEQFRGNLKFL
ncbi:dihydroorotate dehydrogenase [Hokovirus HKV1]|uniref:Dihydroorotate dehydrogenase n=1 Tax=Hokovirus HKV1 TaxID=1977638 RepID=A0A1V0SH91_9VIRU|nr:dihydroorotate dehydrogenase [Hokovirus HKV1]